MATDLTTQYRLYSPSRKRWEYADIQASYHFVYHHSCQWSTVYDYVPNETLILYEGSIAVDIQIVDSVDDSADIINRIITKSPMGLLANSNVLIGLSYDTNPNWNGDTSMQLDWVIKCALTSLCNQVSIAANSFYCDQSGIGGHYEAFPINMYGKTNPQSNKDIMMVETMVEVSGSDIIDYMIANNACLRNGGITQATIPDTTNWGNPAQEASLPTIQYYYWNLYSDYNQPLPPQCVLSSTLPYVQDRAAVYLFYQTHRQYAMSSSHQEWQWNSGHPKNTPYQDPPTWHMAFKDGYLRDICTDFANVIGLPPGTNPTVGDYQQYFPFTDQGFSNWQDASNWISNQLTEHGLNIPGEHSTRQGALLYNALNIYNFYTVEGAWHDNWETPQEGLNGNTVTIADNYSICDGGGNQFIAYVNWNGDVRLSPTRRNFDQSARQQIDSGIWNYQGGAVLSTAETLPDVDFPHGATAQLYAIQPDDYVRLYNPPAGYWDLCDYWGGNIDQRVTDALSNLIRSLPSKSGAAYAFVVGDTDINAVGKRFRYNGEQFFVSEQQSEIWFAAPWDLKFIK